MSTATSSSGTGTAPRPASAAHPTSRPANWPAGRPARPRRSSTARASGARKKGVRIDPSGYDAGKGVKGRQRPIPVDTLGPLLTARVHPAGIRDRDGALPPPREARRLSPFVERPFADGGYQGPATAAAVRALGARRLEIVKRSDQAVGFFVVLPQRRTVERTCAWLGRCRRLARDVETLTRTARACLRLAIIRLMLRRIAGASAKGAVP